MICEKKITMIHKELGIADSYQVDRGIPLQQEAIDLVESELDIFSRKQQMTPHTFECWSLMKNAALADQVEIQLISAFRSIEYQKTLILGKLDKGQNIEDILKVNAAPGFSEHHTGRALDMGTPDCDLLTEEFETTAAFFWLTEHANKFSFSMTYPKNNRFHIDYEPWHWTCVK